MMHDEALRLTRDRIANATAVTTIHCLNLPRFLCPRSFSAAWRVKLNLARYAPTLYTRLGTSFVRKSQSGDPAEPHSLPYALSLTE